MEGPSTSDERGPVRPALVAAAIGAVVWPVVPFTVALQTPSYAVSVDALLLLLFAVLVPRARGVALGAYALLLGWEVIRSTGAVLMDQDPLLYDLIYLLRHFAVLGQDLLGWLLAPVVLGVVLVLVLGVVFGGWLLDRGRHGPRSEWVGIAAGIGLIVWAADGPARFSSVALGRNLVESVAVRGDVDDLVKAPPYDPFDGLSLASRPDLHVYVVESYGRILHKRKSVRSTWEDRTYHRDKRLQAAGYETVSAFVTAPVSGGRSWLADATLLTGRRIAHESVFRQVMARVDGMVHLPGILGDAGYDTILVRPKDRARPGVSLRNDLAFRTTVFFDELAYPGAPVGWGWIPDQYTLGWLAEERLSAPDGPPRFVFAHLVSSHAPWHVVPPVAKDWRDAGEGVDPAEQVPHEADRRGALDELWLQLGRYQRREGHRGKRKAAASHVQRYADAVDYDLEVLTDHLLALPDRPAVVVLLGDHQPPLVARSDDFDVPVHVLSRDPALLASLRDHGFQQGWALSPDARPVGRMEGLMTLFLHQLAAPDGLDLPVWMDGL